MRVKPYRMVDLKCSSSYSFLRGCASIVVVSFGFPMGCMRNGCDRAANSKRLWKHVTGENCCILGAHKTP